MGLLGAGISTLASRIMMVVVFAVIFFCTRRYHIYKEGFLHNTLNRADFLHLNKLGWPIAMQMGMETASFSLSAIMVGWIGTTGSGGPPSDARHFPNLLYDVLWHGSSRCRAG